MNYNEYYARQAGGALPYFAGAQYQRGHGLGSRFGGLLRSALPLIKSGAVALGKGALKTGVRIADDVMSLQQRDDARDRRPRNVRPTYSITMAFVHRQLCEGVNTELDLFTVPPTQTSIVDSHVVEHQPMPLWTRVDR